MDLSSSSHVLVALVGHVPAIKDELLLEGLDNALMFHQLITENVGENALAVV